MDQNKINALIHLRECIDAMREGRDGDGQFSQKAYELIEELLVAARVPAPSAAPTSEVVTWAVMFDGRVCYAPYDTETEANARLKKLSWPVGEGGRGYVAALALAAPSAPQEPRGEPGEAVRMRPVSLQSDMGPQVLTAIIEDDGDVDLRLFDEQCGGISWQACVPGTGGGRYPHTLRALRALVHAMHLDAALQEPTYEECRYCDGCGWTEGGMTFMTDCPKCNGTGRVERK